MGRERVRYYKTIALAALLSAPALAPGCGATDARTDGGNGVDSGAAATADLAIPDLAVTSGCHAATDCDDGCACTIDACSAGACSHTIGPNSGATACPVGQFCALGHCCVQSPACAKDADCVDGNACHANLHCDLKSSICVWTTLDKDGDKHPPQVCGGDDCDDNDPSVYPGASEVCDGKDNDCDGRIDNGATCADPLKACLPGASAQDRCACKPENTCGPSCVDKTTDPSNCGACGTVCQAQGQKCQAGNCACPGVMGKVCNGVCKDVATDAFNCGGCDNRCQDPTKPACVAGACTCAKPCNGSCIDLSSDPRNCGACGTVCMQGDICAGGQCGCLNFNPGIDMAGHLLARCANDCVDLNFDPNNCGGCGKTCPIGMTCQSSTCR